MGTDQNFWKNVKEGKFTEQGVYLHLNGESKFKKTGHMFTHVAFDEKGKWGQDDIVSPEKQKNGCDIIEAWEDGGQHHEIWHEIKWDKVALGNSQHHFSSSEHTERLKELMRLFVNYGMPEEQKSSGTLFIEQEWYENYKQFELTDEANKLDKHYIWFVFMPKECGNGKMDPSWCFAIRVEMSKLIEAVESERKCGKAKWEPTNPKPHLNLEIGRLFAWDAEAEDPIVEFVDVDAARALYPERDNRKNCMGKA